MKSIGQRFPLLFIFITVFVDMLGYGIILPLLPFYVQNQDGGAAIVGMLGSLYALMQLLSGPVLGALSDRHGRRPVLLTCLLGTSAAYLMLGLAGVAASQQAGLLYPCIGLVALGSGLSIPALTGLTSSRVEAGAQGRLMGGMQGLLSLTMIIGPTLAGFSFAFVGTSAPYWLGSLLAGSALVLAHVSLRGEEANTEGLTTAVE